MLKINNVFIFFMVFSLVFIRLSFAYTTEHHAVNMARDLVNVIASPLKAVFWEGPKEVAKMYKYEVKELEKPEDRNKLSSKLFAVVSAPAVETKAIIDGVVKSVTFAGKFFKEFLSIPFSD